MKKVFQRIMDAGKGDCMKCAVATLLGLEYEEVPHFLEFENPNGEMINFMIDNGYEYQGCLYNYPNSEYSDIHKLKDETGIDGLFYASVYSPKYVKEEDGWEAYQVMHAVLVNKNYEIVFDPNSAYQGLEKYPFQDIIGYGGIKHVYLFEKMQN